MTYVVDASVAFKWAVNEPHSDKARRLRDDYRSGVHELLAVDIFPAKVGNALVMAERRGIVPAGTGPALLASVMAAVPRLHTSLPDLLPRGYEIAIQAHRTIYDCLYVALAEREGCKLVTADLRLLNALGSLFPFVIPVASLP